MIRNVLTHIGGIELYGVASISLFFVFFVGMLIWAFRLSRRHLDGMSRLPLEDPGADRPFAHSDSQPNTAHE